MTDGSSWGSVVAVFVVALGLGGCSGGGDDMPGGAVGTDKIVDCPCAAAGTVTGTVAGREFTGIATGLIEPDIGDLSLTLYEAGDPPVCYQSGRVEVPVHSGARVIMGLCIPPTGSRSIGGAGGPVGTHCTDRSDSASVMIVDDTGGDVGEFMDNGSVVVTSADGECVSGTLSASNLTVMGGAQITETLSGTFTVPNASCWSAWTENVTKYCP